jgi:hypothetical protein
MSHASIFVLVEDSTRKPVESASVTLRPAPRKPGITLNEDSPGNYSAAVAPGSYLLEVSKQGYLRESYEVTLSEGRNSTQVVLGKRGQPFFYAAGRKIYFERVPDEFLVVAQGENASAVSERVLARRGMSGVEALSRAGEPRPVRDASFIRVSTPKAKRPDVKAMRAIIGDLEKSGLRATTAVIVKRGDGPVQGLTSDLMVKFEEGVSEREASRIAKSHGLKVKRRVLSAGNSYLLTSDAPPLIK